jgi:F-type H+-transporting ATPase subunit b
MAEGDSYTAHAEAPAPTGHGQAGVPSVVDFSGSLMIVTWIAFLVMSYILYKVAWKPILLALETREERIRRALQDAEKARAELARIEAHGRQVLAQAETEGLGIVAAAQTAAQDLVKAAQAEASREAAAALETAKKDIRAATEQARVALRAETADLVTTLASRLIGQDMDAEKNRALVERLSKEL